MWKIASLLVLLAAVPLSASSRSVTVKQLEATLTAAHGKSDSRLAQRLAGLVLTERLDETKLAHWQQALPGPESRRTLIALADLSSFLPLPPGDAVIAAAPDLTTQRQIIASAVNYAGTTIHQLPNFSATRDTIHYENSPPTITPMNRDFVESAMLNEPLHAISRSSATVLYRDGNEVVEAQATQAKTTIEKPHGLSTSGEFGPILATVLIDAAQGKLAWGHWEHGSNGLVAVFRFEIPRKESHYQVEFCCSAEGGATLQQYSGYHGEMTVNPADGSILRLMLQADLKPDDKIARADILVEYGPVNIGGMTYICPLRSVSVARGPIFTSSSQRPQLIGELAANNILQTSLNDVAFNNYHVFRAESRILTAKEADAIENSPAPAPTKDGGTPPAASSSEVVALTPAVSAHENASASASAAAASPAPLVPDSSKDVSPAKTEPVAPEISEVSSADIPSAPLSATPSLRVTTRLVDIGVVALDKKGHPVTDLKQEDFEIYDNGQKQIVRSFTSPGLLSASDSAGTSPPGSSADQPLYSNYGSHVADSPTASGERGSSATILLIDGNNLAFADLTFVRSQVLRFLDGVAANERIGLYVQNARGFQILAEETTDHRLVAAKARAWMPNAQELARAQDEQERNREQIDEVAHVDDLAYVNSNQNSTGQPEVMVDPQLRNLGGSPGRSAMLDLVNIARHLAAIPGHKNLVWIASENVLADWADKAIGIEKGSKNNDAFFLRAQEALNEAHVSIYPLDASQLETQATDASLYNPSVGLAPGVLVPPGAASPQGGQKGGRQAAEMQQDIHPVQGAIQEVARATGGHIFRRGGDIARNLSSVVDDGRASYLLGFTPDRPADDQYHALTVKLTSRRDVVLRYRTGYEYSKEPATMQDRFRQAVWQANDVREIALSASPLTAYSGTAFRLKIAAGDLALNRQGDRWMDKIDIFVVRRSPNGLTARVTGRTLALALQQTTYDNLKDKGIPFDQFVEKAGDTASLRILVIDQNSGRMGSVTIPASVSN